MVAGEFEGVSQERTDRQPTAQSSVGSPSKSAEALRLVRLFPIMELTLGRPEIVVGLIDGPVELDHPDLHAGRAQVIARNSVRQGVGSDGSVSSHGTFMAGILWAVRSSAAPAICPACSFLVSPVFDNVELNSVDPHMPSASAHDVADAIISCIDEGAKVINLSASPGAHTLNLSHELSEALTYALHKGTIVISAAGNQGSVGASALARHPAVLPVTACDLAGTPLDYTNLGNSIGRRGLASPGQAITSLGTAARAVTWGGTSVATAFVTGAVALLWSVFPEASSEQIRRAITGACKNIRRSIVPPLLDAGAAYDAMLHMGLRSEVAAIGKPHVIQAMPPPISDYQANTVASPDHAASAWAGDPLRAMFLSADADEARSEIMDGSVGGQPGTATDGGTGAAASSTTTGVYVYALGRIEPRFPSTAIEKEFAQAAGRSQTVGLTDRQVLRTVLDDPQNRYLARSLVWVLTIGGLENYILIPRDPMDLNLLVESLRPDPRATDIDAVIGVKGPIAPPEIAAGITVPILAFDQLYSFDVDGLIESIPRPEKTSAEKFRPIAEELLSRVMQLADNSGATDEHRALNYLVLRYPGVYAMVAEEYSGDTALTGVEVRDSRLGPARKILDVIFRFTNRKAGYETAYFVRVDVTELYPFLVTKLSPYYDH